MQRPELTTVLTSLVLFAIQRTACVNIAFTIPPTPLLPNPSTLPSSTQATLYAHNSTHTALLTRANSFLFRDVAEGSYLLTTQCRDYAFGPLRVDVTENAQGTPHEGAAGAATPAAQSHENAGQVHEVVEVHQTFWGNEWRNKGERRGGGRVLKGSEEAVTIEMKPDRAKEYYTRRQGFSPLDFLKSPMILIALFSLVLIVGMPYIMDNMDEETRAEFEEIQAKSPMAKAANPGAALQNFDLAGWMAGSTKSDG